MGKTIWQEVIADGLEQYGPQKQAAEKQAMPTQMPKDTYISELDEEAERLGKGLASVNGTIMPGTPIEQSQDSSVPIMPKPIATMDPNLTVEEHSRLQGSIQSDIDVHQAVSDEIAQKYGPEFFSMQSETRRQIMEYETEEILGTQFGMEPERSTMGSLVQGAQEGFESNFSGSLATMVEAYTGTGGRLLGKDPTTGGRSLYTSYSELIPGFDDMSYEDRRKAIVKWKRTEFDKNAAERDASREGAAFTVGQVGGFLADPTTAIPIGQSYKLAALSSGMIGASDMFVYDLAQKGVIEPQRIATAATLGAAVGPLGLWASRSLSKYMGTRGMNKALDKYEKEYTRAFAAGESKDFAEVAARVASGNIDQASLDDLYRTTGRTKVIPDTPKAARQVLEERMSFLHRSERLRSIGTKFENVITPISDVVNRVSPKLGHGLRKMELNTHLVQNQWFTEVKPFLQQLRKFSKADRTDVKRMLSSGKAEQWGRLYSLLKKYEGQGGKFKGLTDNFDNVRSTLRDVQTRYRQLGYDLEPIPHYFPRVVHNPSALKKVPYSFLQDALENERRALGRELTAHDTSRVVEKLIKYKVSPHAKVKTSGSLREREIDTLSAAMLPHYADPEAALHSYLRMAALDTERARFLTHFGAKKSYKTSGGDIGSRVGEVIQKEAARLDLGWEKQDRLISVLQSRFTTGEASPSPFIRGFKNLGYTTTLGNPLSAITQLGDQAFGIYKNNLLNTLRGMLPRKSGAGRHIVKAELGLTDAMEEIYANPSALKKALDFSLEYGGFNMMDEFGKNSIINGAMHKYARMLTTDKGKRKFAAQWGKYFENDTTTLMADLQHFGKKYPAHMRSGKKKGQTIEKYGEMTDNIRLLLWHELAEVQPIALSEMPKFYLDHPNGRVLYMLKTFTVKQLDFMRREIARKFVEGKHAEAGKNLAYFATLWTMMNGAADGLKTVFTGEPFDVADNAVDNLAQLMLWSRYSEAKFEREGAGGAVKDFLAPPTPFIDKPTQAVIQGDMTKAIEPIPIVGMLLAKRMRENKRRIQALQSGK